jgi:hypothetical protein
MEVNTVVGCIRKIFRSSNSILVTAPTRAAAHNVGGQTIHREFKLNFKKMGNKLSDKAKKQVKQKLIFTIALFFDERSMISQHVLGSAELNIIVQQLIMVDTKQRIWEESL